MLAIEFRLTLEKILGRKWLPWRASMALGRRKSSVLAWLDGKAPVPPEITQTVLAIARMEPARRPIAWLHWDCRVDLHEHAAVARAQRLQRRQSEGLSQAQQIKLYTRARRRARSQLVN